MPRKLLCSLSRSPAERERGELLGLQWKDLNDNKLRIERQLFTGGTEAPTFIPPKRDSVRTVDLADETVRLPAVAPGAAPRIVVVPRKVG